MKKRLVGVALVLAAVSLGSIQPVSYTHLDVYKRQVYICANKGWKCWEV